MHAIRDREREGTQTIAGKGATADKQTNSFPLSGDGEWHTDEPVVVDKYTQTRQRLLRAKIVKSGHSRHYKGSLLPCTEGETSIRGVGISKPRNRKQVLRKRNSEKKDTKGEF